MKFKVGDKIRYIGETIDSFTKGNIYTCTGYLDDNVLVLKDDQERTGNGHYEKYWQLESESNLEDLIKKANEGFESYYKLQYTYNEKFIYTNSRGISNVGQIKWEIPAKISLKPKFESFTIGSNWKVELDEDNILGNKISIGCQKFTLESLKANLFALLHESQLSTEFFATRSGITYSQGISNKKYSISWADAEKLYEAIKDL